MGHEVTYMTFNKDASSETIDRARALYIEDNGARDDGILLSTDSGYRLHKDIICDSYEEAVDKIAELDKGWYDDHGVLYKAYKGQNKGMIANRDKYREVREKRAEYIKANEVQNRTSETITCPKCKSRLNLSYLNGQSCPLCRTDLRSTTVLNRIESFDKKLKELDKKHAELEKKQKYELKWLVKLEFHV